MAAERDAHERRMADEREALRVQQDALNAERKRIADEAAERQRAEEAAAAAKAQAEADRVFAEYTARMDAAEAADRAKEAADTAMRDAAQAMFDALEKMLDCFVDDPLSYQYTSGAVIEAARDALALARPLETTEAA
jgi:DNA repair exonuclease SbcCD ATPase subunit